MIELKNLSHSFENSGPLLKNVFLSLRRGETFVIAGPSGQGKSTLLKIISGLIKPNRGEVLIEGESLYEVSKSRQAEIMNKTGMLFQKNALFDSLTVGENLAFALKESTSLNDADIDVKVLKYLKAVGLEGTQDLYPDEISGGMQKRVGIARALILEPELILYDDPTAGLDPITSRLIAELILSLRQNKDATTVAVTNDMGRAFQLADRMGLLMDHELIITGTVEETKNSKDKKVQAFIRGEFNAGADDVT